MFGTYLPIGGQGVLLLKTLPAEVAVAREAPFDELLGARGHIVTILPSLEIGQGRRAREGLGVVGLGSTQHVADILDRVFVRHLLGDDAAPIEIGPVFPMVLVPLGMVLANLGEIMVAPPLLVHRAMGAGVILGARDEFSRPVFGEIVLQGMEKDAAVRCVPDDLVAMLGDGDQMVQEVVFHFRTSGRIWATLP